LCCAGISEIFMGSETNPSTCYILSKESSLPFYSTGIKTKNIDL